MGLIVNSSYNTLIVNTFKNLFCYSPISQIAPVYPTGQLQV